MNKVSLKKIVVTTCLTALFVFTNTAVAKPFGHFTEPKVYPADPNDPYQIFNRAAFAFNDALDNHFLKPIAKTYNYVIPKPGRQAVTNFFRNVGEVPIIINDLLQVNLSHFAADSWRFVINSTCGIGGIFDLAGKMGIPYHSNDFGITMAKWGYRNSVYFVIPILGPSTVRDAFAIPIEYYGMSLYPWVLRDFWVRAAVLSVNGLSLRANALSYSGVIDQAAFDPYVFQRDAYMQHRKYEIQQALSKDTSKPENDAGMSSVEASEPPKV